MNLIIKKTKAMGRGVFANKNFKQGELIEVCPLLYLGEENSIEWGKTQIWEYIFGVYEKVYLALGYGSLYNHATKNNADYHVHEKSLCIEFVALKNIKKGEQIFINYGWDENCYKFNNHSAHASLE